MQGNRQIPIVCPGHTRPLTSLTFLTPASAASEGPFLISSSHDKTPMLRDGKSGDWIGSFVGHKGAVWSAKMDKDGNLCATASGDFTAMLWDGITGQKLGLYTHKHIVKTVDFSPGGDQIATGGNEGLLRIFDLSRYKEDKAKHQVQVMEKGKGGITQVSSMLLSLLLSFCLFVFLSFCLFVFLYSCCSHTCMLTCTSSLDLSFSPFVAVVQRIDAQCSCSP